MSRDVFADAPARAGASRFLQVCASAERARRDCAPGWQHVDRARNRTSQCRQGARPAGSSARARGAGGRAAAGGANRGRPGSLPARAGRRRVGIWALGSSASRDFWPRCWPGLETLARRSAHWRAGICWRAWRTPARAWPGSWRTGRRPPGPARDSSQAAWRAARAEFLKSRSPASKRRWSVSARCSSATSGRSRRCVAPIESCARTGHWTSCAASPRLAGGPGAAVRLRRFHRAADRHDPDTRRRGRTLALTVSLAYEPGRVAFLGRASTFQRLAPLADSHTELRARADHYAPSSRETLYHLERSLFSDDPRQVEPGEAVRLLEGGSPRAELELLAGEVRALLDDGVRAQEIAIVHRSPESIACLLGEVLEDFDVPYAAAPAARCSPTPRSGAACLGMLRCVTEVGELGDLLAWLGAPGVLERPELLDRFERSARRRGVLDGARARALWESENWPLQRIDRVREAAASGTLALLDALAGELQRLFCAPRGNAASVLGEDERDEAGALVGARRALEELRELARATPELAPERRRADRAAGAARAGGRRASGAGTGRGTRPPFTEGTPRKNSVRLWVAGGRLSHDRHAPSPDRRAPASRAGAGIRIGVARRA